MNIDEILDDYYFESLQKAIEVFGKKSQYKKTVEEIAEMLVEINQLHFERASHSAVAEELGDSFIMFTQLLMLFEYNVGEIKSVILEAKQLSLNNENNYDENYNDLITNTGLLLSIIYTENKPQQILVSFLTSIFDMISFFGEEKTTESMIYKVKRLNNRIEEFIEYNK